MEECIQYYFACQSCDRKYVNTNKKRSLGVFVQEQKRLGAFLAAYKEKTKRESEYGAYVVLHTNDLYAEK